MKTLLLDILPCSKPLGGSKVDSAFHPSKVDKMSTKNFWELSGKKKLIPRSGSSLEAVEPHFKETSIIITRKRCQKIYYLQGNLDAFK